MNYEKAEKRLSDMNEKDILNDNDYEFLDEIGKSDDMCIKCDAADLLINYKTKQAVEILKTLSDDNDATVRASAYDNMWVFEKQDFDEILRKAVSCESDGIARLCYIFFIRSLFAERRDTAELIDFMPACKTEKDRRCKLPSITRNFYISGETDKLGEIIGYLEDKDYRMRITVVNTISEILNKENKEVLLSVVKKRLKRKKAGQ